MKHVFITCRVNKINKLFMGSHLLCDLVWHEITKKCVFYYHIYIKHIPCLDEAEFTVSYWFLWEEWRCWMQSCFLLVPNETLVLKILWCFCEVWHGNVGSFTTNWTPVSVSVSIGSTCYHVIQRGLRPFALRAKVEEKQHKFGERKKWKRTLLNHENCNRQHVTISWLFQSYSKLDWNFSPLSLSLFFKHSMTKQWMWAWPATHTALSWIMGFN